MLTRSKKAKGKALEKLVLLKLLDKFKLSEEDIRIPVGSEHGSDIKLTNKAVKIIPWKIECKNRSKIGVYTWYQQAKQHKGDNLEPILIIKQDYAKPLVIIDLDYFLLLFQSLINKDKKNGGDSNGP